MVLAEASETCLIHRARGKMLKIISATAKARRVSAIEGTAEAMPSGSAETLFILRGLRRDSSQLKVNLSWFRLN